MAREAMVPWFTGGSSRFGKQHGMTVPEVQSPGCSDRSEAYVAAS